ncbi:MAG: pantoate--beta-alanine ligase [Alphaproteobacteria bacterium]
MSGQTQTIRMIADLRRQVQDWRSAGDRVALVPTMGALHEGHLSLMQLAQQKADRLVVSIFVNPTQFGPNEDFEAYPRVEDDDIEHLNNLGADVAFAPAVNEMYPAGFATEVRVTGLTDVLCGAHRPGHFDGVTQIVAKLLLQCLPDIAIFGEKDYQQLQVIRRMTADLNIPVDILGGPIVREADGLALSSRNRYLSEHQRHIAAQFPRELKAVRDRVLAGGDPIAACDTAKLALSAAGFDAIDYVEVRHTDTLDLAEPNARPARVFGAARIGKTRLIDNWAVE